MKRLLWLVLFAAVQVNPTAVTFVDVSERAGLHFHHENSSTPEKYLVETMGSGCAFIDYDGDGLLDIFLINGGWVPGTSKSRDFNHKLYRNRGDGTFEDVSNKARIGPNTAYGMGVAVGDYDNDGWDDLFITNFNGPNILYHNNGNGTFTDVTTKAGVAGDGQWSASATFLDYDNDGFVDLWVTRYVDHSFTNNKICGPYSERGIRGYCTPQIYNGLSNVLYHNNGDGTFTDVSLKAGIAKYLGKGLGVTVLDYNDDGYSDVYVANDSVANFLFRNNKDGTFSEVGLESGVALDENGQPQAGMGTFSGDIDGDGRPDIVVTNLDFEYLDVYRNMGKGIFEDASTRMGVQLATRAFVGFGVALLDFDNSGRLGMFVANGHILDNAPQIRQGATYAQRKLLFENTGRVFKENAAAHGSALMKPQVSRGLAVGDFDNDGGVDLLVTNNGGSPMLLHNEGATQNSWLTVKLAGSKSNAHGIGARIELEAGSSKQIRDITASGSYLSSNDYRAHFGLGNWADDVTLTIHWPSGKSQTEKVHPRQIVAIREATN
jgi:hypothetical protein